MSQITKRALEASLKKLLTKKPLDKITITDITEDCGINRMTFYYHFKDIYDLVEWVCVEDATRILGENKTYDTWQEGFLRMQVRDEDKKFIADFYKCSFVGVLLEWIENGMKRDPHVIVDKMGLVMHDNITRALEAFRTDAFHKKTER